MPMTMPRIRESFRLSKNLFKSQRPIRMPTRILLKYNAISQSAIKINDKGMPIMVISKITAIIGGRSKTKIPQPSEALARINIKSVILMMGSCQKLIKTKPMTKAENTAINFPHHQDKMIKLDFLVIIGGKL